MSKEMLDYLAKYPEAESALYESRLTEKQRREMLSNILQGE